MSGWKLDLTLLPSKFDELPLIYSGNEFPRNCKQFTQMRELRMQIGRLLRNADRTVLVRDQNLTHDHDRKKPWFSTDQLPDVAFCIKASSTETVLRNQQKLRAVFSHANISPEIPFMALYLEIKADTIEKIIQLVPQQYPETKRYFNQNSEQYDIEGVVPTIWMAKNLA